MADEKMVEENKDNCSCLNITCENHGKCRECITRHLGLGNKVFCMRDKVEEKK